MAIVMGGEKPWRVLADVDEQGRLAGNCWIRLPGDQVMLGHLTDYRRLRALLPREVYIALRELKNTYQAEQSGLVGHA